MQSEGLSLGLHCFFFGSILCAEELRFCAGFPFCTGVDITFFGFDASTTLQWPVSFRLRPFPVALGSVYTGKSFRYSCLDRFLLGSMC